MTKGLRWRFVVVTALCGMILGGRLPTPLRAQVVDRIVRSPTATASAPPPQAPRALVPPALDRQVAQVTVFLGCDLEDSYSFVMLAEGARVPMGIEQWPLNPNPGIPRGVCPPALVLGPGKLSAALDTLLDRQPLYNCRL